MSDDLTLPAKPEGDETDGLTPPTKPEGEQDDMKQPPEAKTVELDVSDAAITEDGEDASLENIEVGDMLTVELDEDGNVVSVTIDDQPAAGGQFAPVGQPGQDAPRGGFNGGMMQPGFSMEPDKAKA